MSDDVRKRILGLTTDKAAEVRLQVAIAARKITGIEPLPTLIEVLVHSDDDNVIPRVVWQNLLPDLADHAREFAALVRPHDLTRKKALAAILPRATELLLARAAAADQPDPAIGETLIDLFELILDADPSTARRCLDALASMVRTGELTTEKAGRAMERLAARLQRILDGPANKPLYADAAILTASFGNERGRRATRRILEDRRRPVALRLRALDTLISVREKSVLPTARRILQEPAQRDRRATTALQTGVLAALGRLGDKAVADMVLKSYRRLLPAAQPKAIDLLTQRTTWSRALIAAIDAKTVSASAINGNQVRMLRTAADPATAKRIAAIFGEVRKRRNAGRDLAIANVHAMLKVKRGDAKAGVAVFGKHCGQCHKIYGQGTELGPDLTANGRSSLDQLLSNVLDPNLVVGDAYHLRSAETKDGRLIAGLLVEENKTRIVLRTVGGDTETIPRSHLKELLSSPASFMPEALEASMSEQELLDLFAFLMLDKHPEDATAAPIRGLEHITPRATQKPAEFEDLLHAVAPGFSVSAVDGNGVTLLEKHHGRYCVIRTHPVKRDVPCVLEGSMTLPPNRATHLALALSYAGPVDGNQDWRIVVKVDGTAVHRSIVGKATAKNGWVDLSVDLSAYAGKRITLELLNEANNWAGEFGHWGRVALVDAGPKR